jgi:hypothetical protein
MNAPNAYPDLHSRLRALWAAPFVTGDIAADVTVYQEADQRASDVILLAETYGAMELLGNADDFVGLLAVSNHLTGIHDAVKALKG